MTSPLTTALLTALALTATASTAAARGGDERELRGEWLAAPDVRALVSEELDGALHRALVLDQRGRPELVLEVHRRGVAGGLEARRVVTQVQHGLSVYALADVGRAIDQLALGGGRLAFALVVDGAREPLQCRVDVRGQALPTCEGRMPAVDARPPLGRPPVVPGRPPRPSWASRPEVIAACGTAFYGEANELACLERVGAFVRAPVPTIEACDRHAYGDEAALQCLALTAPYMVEPAPVIAACDLATYGQESFLDCLRQAIGFRFDPVATIQACDQAMYGDQSTIACIGVATRYPSDATPTIQACDQAMYGDEAALTCIRRGGAY